MTQPAPERTVAGPPPRRRPIDASRLLKDNRTPPPAQSAKEPARAEAAHPGPRLPEANPRLSVAEEPKETITVTVRANVRRRSRTAFREANYRERVRSYSDFVERAIEREITRIEATYNDGQPLPADDEPLTPGRPTGT